MAFHDLPNIQQMVAHRLRGNRLNFLPIGGTYGLETDLADVDHNAQGRRDGCYMHRSS